MEKSDFRSIHPPEFKSYGLLSEMYEEKELDDPDELFEWGAQVAKDANLTTREARLAFIEEVRKKFHL